MDANRWKQIKKVYDRALDLSGDKRADFLTEACASDADLHREIESLLAAHEDAGTFLQSPAVEVAAHEIVADEVTSPTPQLVGLELANYRIVSLLGMGGMGEVYLAEDKRLHRKVALKLLPLQFTNDPDRVRRFEREARAISALNHPNIMTIFEIGQAGGLWFMATEFIEGQTLRQRLAASEPIPPREVIKVSAQIADALAAAHGTGVVHRDVKPENVMLRHDGYVKVLDFGLAKVTEGLTANDHSPPPLSSLTAAGTVMGTVSYMSPEQARGQEVDGRTDIFSLGVVMYEMLAGRLPFEGATASDMIASILRSEPPALAKQAPHTPAELETIVMKALAKDREARWQKVGSLADKLRDISQELEFKVRLADSDTKQLPYVSAAPAKLRWRAIGLAALAVLMLLMALLAWHRKQPSEKPSEQTEKPSEQMAGNQVKTLAVLPLRTIGVKGDEKYLGLVMAEALITRLSSVRRITVRPTEAVLRYQDGMTDSQAAGRELRVDAVLTGSVQKINDRVLVRVQLFRQSEQQPVWDDEFTHTGADLFALQSSIAEQVTVALALKLTGEERQRLNRRYTENTEAHQLYVQGLDFLHKRTTEGIRQAIAFFDQAVARDSGYAPAYVYLGLAWNRLVERNVVPMEEGVSNAKAAVRRALVIDDTLGEAHSFQAILRLVYDWDVPGAERELQRAIELDPNNAMTLQWQGVHLLARGRADEAVAVTRRAFELNPVSLNVRSQLCRALYLARQYDEAIAASQELIQMDANYSSAWAYLGQSYMQKGMHSEAVSALQKADSQAGVTGEIRAALGHAYASAGRRDEAQNVIADLKTKPSGSGILYHLATVYTALGQSDEAITWLTIAFDRHDPFVVNRVRTDPKLDPLRNDPRFNALLQRIER